MTDAHAGRSWEPENRKEEKRKSALGGGRLAAVAAGGRPFRGMRLLWRSCDGWQKGDWPDVNWNEPLTSHALHRRLRLTGASVRASGRTQSRNTCAEREGTGIWVVELVHLAAFQRLAFLQGSTHHRQHY